MRYLRRSNSLVEEVYKLQKAGGWRSGKLRRRERWWMSVWLQGATELRDLIYTAWVRSGDPLPPYRAAPKGATPGV